MKPKPLGSSSMIFCFVFCELISLVDENDLHEFTPNLPL